MSAVEILAAGAKADSGVGAAVDVSGFSTLRMNATLSADFGTQGGTTPWLRLFIDTAPTENGPWSEVWRRHFDLGHTDPASPYWWDPNPRIVLAGFDAFLRARWEGGGRLTGSNPIFSIAMAGDGQPDAA